jgi:hypothetical protein
MTSTEMIQVADRTVKIKEVLSLLGYEIWRVPLQIPCPVHKFGQESHPSARIYTEDASTIWCFYCVEAYWPTQVWEARKGVSREAAADEFLKRWPVAQDRVQAILRTVLVPSRPAPEAVYRDLLERHLREHRGSSDFRVYRKWAKGVDEFSLYLGELKQEMREVGVQSFVEKMNQDLLDSYLERD